MGPIDKIINGFFAPPESPAERIDPPAPFTTKKADPAYGRIGLSRVVPSRFYRAVAPTGAALSWQAG